MANSSRRTSQLGITTTLAADDRVVVLTRPSNTMIANTQTIALSDFVESLGGGLSGPHADDLAAGFAGVPMSGIYYDINGNVKIRMM